MFIFSTWPGLKSQPGLFFDRRQASSRVAREMALQFSRAA